MNERLNNYAPKKLLRYPALWGEDLLHTFATGKTVVAAANRTVLPSVSMKLAGCKRYSWLLAERWGRYRCAWLYARTSLRDVAPDEVIRVAPGGGPGIYEVVERWRYREHYRNLEELGRLVEAFHRAVRLDRTSAVLNRAATAPG
jgi:hypothetical protein